MSFCTTCGGVLPADARFCGSCGSAVASRGSVATIEPSTEPSTQPSTETSAQPPTQPPTEPPTQPQARRHFGPLLPSQRQAETFNRLLSMPPALIRSALAAGALSLLAPVLVLVGTTVVVALVALPDGQHGSPVDWFRTGVAVLALVLLGSAQLAVRGTLDPETELAVQGSAALVIRVAPLVLTLGVAAALYWQSRRAEKRSPSPDLVRLVTAALITAASFALAATVLVLLAAGDVGYGLGKDESTAELAVRLSGSAWSVLPGALGLGALVSVRGRLAGYARARGARRTWEWLAGVGGPWIRDLLTARTLVRATLAAAVVSGAGACVWLAITDVTSGGSGAGTDDGTPAWLALVLLWLPNALLAGTAFVLGSTLTFSDQATTAFGPLNDDIGLLAGGVSGATYLVVVPVVVAVALAGVRATLGRPAAGREVISTVRIMACFAGFWLAASWLLNVSIGGSGDVGLLGSAADTWGRATLGVGDRGLLLCTVFWAGAALIAGPVLARVLAGWRPALAFRIGGRGTHDDWRLLLADMLIERVAEMPAGLVLSATAIRDGAVVPEPPVPLSRRRDRLWVLATVATMVLVGGGAVTYQVLSERVFGPGAVVGDFYAALADRDPSGALRDIDPVVLKGLDRTLLTPQALRPAGRPAITEIETTDRTATVTVTFTDGAEREFALRRAGTAFGIVPRWKLQDALGRLEIDDTEIPGATGAVTVNGVTTPARSYPVLPGMYTVSVAADRLYLAGSTDVVARDGGTDTAVIESRQDPRLQTIADRAVQEYLDGCAAGATTPMPDCPFGTSEFDYYDVVEPGRWTVTSYPSVTVSIDEDGSVSLYTDSYGSEAGLARFTARGKYWSYDQGYESLADETSFGIGGTLVWAGDSGDDASFEPVFGDPGLDEAD